MFGFGKKKEEKAKVEEDLDDDEDVITWVRYNSDEDEVEESIRIEIHDEDGLEAMTKLIDIKNSTEGKWVGFSYVYHKDGVRKEIRPSDEDMDKF